MNLIDLLRGLTIEGLTLNELKQILTYEHPSIRIRSASNGALALTNRAVIKCVNNYYTNPHKVQSKVSGVNTCHSVHVNFDIEGVKANSCGMCHLQCLYKREGGQLSSVIKKSSTKRRK